MGTRQAKTMLLIRNCEMLLSEGANRWNSSKGDIAVQSGKIVGLGTVPERFRSDRIIDATGKIALPGLVNAHYHSYANLIRTYGENYPLETWMYFAFLSGVFTPEDVHASAMLGCIEMIRSGITTVLDHLNFNTGSEGIEAALEAYVSSGMRAVMSPMVSDRFYYETLPLKDGDLPSEMVAEFRKLPPKSANSILESCQRLILKWHKKHGGVIEILLGPSGPQRCSDELLLGLTELAKRHDLGLHTHLVETKNQAVTAHDQYGCSMIEFLKRLGVLNERWSFAHSVWLSDEDIRLMGANQVSVVHNPASNLMLGSGIAPINKLIRSGVNVALGTDGSNCGGNLSLFRSMALAAMLSKITTPDHEDWRSSPEVLAMATVGGAKAIRMTDRIGTLSVGKRADIILLDGQNTFLTPRMNLVHQLVYSETGQSVDTVIIDGNVVMENKNITTVNEPEVLARAQERYEMLKPRLRSAIVEAERQIPYIDKIYRREIARELSFHRSAAWGSLTPH
jgi:guanine deaminase